MTPERVNEIYDQLATLHIELHADPGSLGPLYLQDLISKTRGYLNQSSLLLQEVSREMLAVSRRLDAQETAFQASSDQLLVEDIEVKNLPNIEDRKAKINLLLHDDIKTIRSLKKELKELGFVEKAVRHKYKDLESAVSSVRMQKSLIEVEQNTGSFYGDETNTSRGNHVLGASTKTKKKKPPAVGEEVFGEDILQYLDAAIKEVKPLQDSSELEELQASLLVSSDVDEDSGVSDEEKQIKAFLEDEEDEFEDINGLL